MKFVDVVESREMSQEETEARWELWRAGDLSWKLKPSQHKLYEALIDQDEIVTTATITRRGGKSFTALVTEIELCIQNPLIICKHACPTQKMVKEMIFPQLRIIFHDAPPEFDLDKMWNASEGKLHFPNGSFISIAGTDGNNADNLRGTYCHFAVCDEAGFMDNLEYVVRQILRPQLLTTGGKMCLISTPNPRVVNHEFHTKFVFPAEALGKLIKFTIFENDLLTPEQIQQEIDSYPRGIDDPAFRVEYLVEVPRSSETSVVPEFYEMKKDIVFKTGEVEVPEYCDWYVSGDIGVKDLTVFIFGYYDFLNAQLVILDEWVKNGMDLTTTSIAAGIQEKETTWFKGINGTQETPKKRVMDNDLKLINDLRILHGLKFTATKKDNKIAQVNNLRVFIQEGRLKIHERCVHLIYHMENAQWKTSEKGVKEFLHLDDSIDGKIKGGHADGLDTIVYMVRNLDQNSNPFPYLPSRLTENQHRSRFKEEVDSRDKVSLLKSITGNFRRKKKI